MVFASRLSDEQSSPFPVTEGVFESRFCISNEVRVYLVSHRCGFFPPAADTLFATTLNAGDVFIFPRGLIHFQQNPNSNATAKAIAALNSQNPGTVVRTVDTFFVQSSGAFSNSLT
jgi:hypothetical protein